MNKYQEALKLAYEMMNAADFGSAKRGCEALKVLQELADKATSKKIIKYSHRYKSGVCPNCYILVYSFMNTYCQNCGQKLDWSEKNDK